VYRVTAGHFMRSITAREQVLLTHGAIGHVLSGLAVVIVEQLRVDAHAAIGTVTEILAASDTAESAFAAMVRIFVVGHPQIANVAMVFAELSLAGVAVVGLAALSSVAQSTNNFPYRESIDFMMRLIFIESER